jgi:hypothetical protein
VVDYVAGIRDADNPVCGQPSRRAGKIACITALPQKMETKKIEAG